MRKSIPALALAAVRRAGAFNLPGLTNMFKPPATDAAAADVKPPDQSDIEARLLEAISGTGNGKSADADTQLRVLSIVRRMESSSPPSADLLSDPDEAAALDGDWYLQYTAPIEVEGGRAEGGDGKGGEWVAEDASEGESKIDTRQFGGAGRVSGGGIPVDASSNGVARQSFDVAASRVTNEVRTGFGLVTVGGSFRRSASVPSRAVVAFDFGRIALDVGPTIDIGFLFDIRAAVRGTKEAGWVETTYLSEDVRIGRGNKGSLFVLTRDRDAVSP